MAERRSGHFGRGLFELLTELEANNNRAWFDANRQRYTRFSKDKTPFKSSAGAQFPHRARTKDRSVPGFYLHLEPGLCMGGGGSTIPPPMPCGALASASSRRRSHSRGEPHPTHPRGNTHE